VIRETSRISVPAESEQAMIVRQFVRLACHRYGCDTVADNVLQVTDELVGIAVARHASPNDTVDVGIVPTSRGVRVEVHDTAHQAGTIGPPVPVARNADEPEGLQIVDSLAVDWGVTDDVEGTTVWAEMAGDPTTSSPAEPG
jgi:hypothetical protein